MGAIHSYSSELHRTLQFSSPFFPPATTRFHCILLEIIFPVVAESKQTQNRISRSLY